MNKLVKQPKLVKLLQVLPWKLFANTLKRSLNKISVSGLWNLPNVVRATCNIVPSHSQVFLTARATIFRPTSAKSKYFQSSIYISFQMKRDTAFSLFTPAVAPTMWVPICCWHPQFLWVLGTPNVWHAHRARYPHAVLGHTAHGRNQIFPLPCFTLLGAHISMQELRSSRERQQHANCCKLAIFGSGS